MSIKIGKKTFASNKAAEKDLKARRPDVKDPKAYVEDTLKIIEQRRAAKAKRVKKN